jgi:hypothetical protein
MVVLLSIHFVSAQDRGGLKENRMMQGKQAGEPNQGASEKETQ